MECPCPPGRENYSRTRRHALSAIPSRGRPGTRPAEAAIEVIANGRDNMPAFGHTYTPQQLCDLTRYVVERLATPAHGAAAPQ